ncbi:hypothetical protein [Streptomyces kurssanovii]|uniref:Uncharacterized protein n=1 Tax=Streptomyces kurssanovii TaxID=67312 RepID=A0ABV3HP20_9ACTN
MPRRRPGHVRAEQRVRERCVKNQVPSISGVSRRTLYEIVRVEETRNYLWTGAVGESLALWRGFVGRPDRRLWRDDEGGCTEWLCCGDPLRARDMLEGAVLALPRRAARELRAVVLALDDRY